MTASNPWRKSEKSGPTRMLREFAESKGITTSKLQSLMARYPGLTALPLARNRRGGNHYALSDLNRWWAEVEINENI